MFEQIIGLIAPHKCLGCGTESTLLCLACCARLTPVESSCFRCHAPTVDYEVCIKCLQQAPLQRVYALTMYSELPKRLVHALKFERSKLAAQYMAHAMHVGLPHLSPNIVVCAVPTASSRVRARGYDQAVLIARAFARMRGLPYADLLKRTDQARQVGADANQRQQQLTASFRLKKPLPDSEQPILLIDDVITTGATLRAASWSLQVEGSRKVAAAVFARAL